MGDALTTTSLEAGSAETDETPSILLTSFSITPLQCPPESVLDRVSADDAVSASCIFNATAHCAYTILRCNTCSDENPSDCTQPTCLDECNCSCTPTAATVIATTDHLPRRSAISRPTSPRLARFATLDTLTCNVPPPWSYQLQAPETIDYRAW